MWKCSNGKLVSHYLFTKHSTKFAHNEENEKFQKNEYLSKENIKQKIKGIA